MIFWKRKVFDLLLTAALLAGTIAPASALSFSGVHNWFQPSLNEMLELGLMPEEFDGMNLSEKVTRGEMCLLAVHALERIVGYSIDPERSDYFSDTNLDYVLKAYELGIVDGYPDGTFKPNDLLTRQEFFQIVENFCNAAAFLPTADGTVLKGFADAANVSGWAEEATQICVRYGYVNGSLNNGVLSLLPKDNTTRQEAMAMFLRAYKSLNEYYYYIKTAEVEVEDNSQKEDEEVVTGEDDVVDDVSITGVEKKMMVSSSGLNVRSSWNADSEILATLPYGAQVNVTGLCDNGWVRIDYKGQVAYVNGEYLDEYQEVDHSANATAVEIAEYAMQFVGYPYVYGAESPSEGFDCSGLVWYTYKQFGYNLPRTADSQMDYSGGIAVSYNNLQVGDLVFFGSGSYANHVGIYIGNNNFVHAANASSGVRVSSMNETYYASRYLGAMRIVLD